MRPWTLPHAVKSFVGHLEGTGRPLNTVDSYRLDLNHFLRILVEAGIDFSLFKTDNLERKHLESFRNSLAKSGLTANSRRRKLHTLMRFLNYLHSRGRVDALLTQKFATPQKVEKIPHVLDFSILRDSILALRAPGPAFFGEDEVLARNQHLAWILLETGALVSEAVEIRWEDVDSIGCTVRLTNRRRTRESNCSSRTVPLSGELIQSLGLSVKVGSDPRMPLFQGILKGTPLGRPMTPRTAELVLEDLRKRLCAPDLTPRQLRHTRIVEWLKEGRDPNWIQECLGLQTQYALKIYAPILNVINSRNI